MIEPATAETIGRAAELLRRGRVVAFPTETVYGLGAHALNERAVAQVFEVKGRPRFDPLIVHVPHAAAAQALAGAWPGLAQRLAEAFWPGPLTLVVPKRPMVPDLVTAGLGTVALRVPGHAVALALLKEAGLPIAAPSANRFGGVSPTRAEHVEAELGDRVAMVLDGGPCETGVESTVVSLVGDGPVVLRLGGVPVEALEEALGASVAVGAPGEPSGSAGRMSPGMLARHYAPGTPVEVVTDVRSAVAAAQAAGRRVGVLAFREPVGGAAATEVLSATGDLREAAAGLFAAMRRLDAAGLDLIVAEQVPEQGLGRAINDRLRRASVRG